MSTLTPRSYAQLHLEGHSDAEIAELCTVSAGYVSQIASQELTVKLVAELGATQAQTQIAQELDSKYDEVEINLLRKLEKAITFLSKPMEISRVLQQVNNAKRRRGPMANPTPGDHTIVQLVVPIAIQNKIVLSPSNEVMEVGGRRMSTMPAANLAALMENRDAQARLAAPSNTTGNPVLDTIS